MAYFRLRGTSKQGYRQQRNARLPRKNYTWLLELLNDVVQGICAVGGASFRHNDRIAYGLTRNRFKELHSAGIESAAVSPRAWRRIIRIEVYDVSELSPRIIGPREKK